VVRRRDNTKAVAWAVAFASCVPCWLLAATAAGQVKHWELEPYRIRVVLALDAPSAMADRLAAALPEYLANRVETAIGPTWRLSTSVADGVIRHRLLAGLDGLSDTALGSGGHRSEAVVGIDPSHSDADKLVVVTVRATPLGYELSGREYDFYVERWGPTLHRSFAQQAALPERLFVLLCQAVAPLARLDIDPTDERRVVLHLRGAGLPHKDDGLPWAEPGDVFLPILRRTTREGMLVPNGIEAVPWTYVQATQVDDGRIVGQLLSGTKRPLGVRRRGRVEQLAIAIRPELSETTIRLHSRTHPDKSLVGYQVFVQNPGQEATEPIGVSDSDGLIRIAKGGPQIRLLYVKSSDQILARVPIVPGAERLVDVPLPDDDVHQQAEARLAALREQLIDVVARRNIFMTRVRQKIEAGQFQQAENLLEALDDLPGRAQFNQALAREARLHRSDDPQVQRRIDRLFAATQLVLGQYLDVRPINKLYDELREARQKAS
jgi:nucleotide-binding universal stress UspA family protein